MIELSQLPWLFGAGLAAGFVDAIAGGGGLISLPVLLHLGLDPRLALGTNKLQSTFGSASATWHYARAGTMPLRDCARGFAVTFAAAIAGALAVQAVNRDALGRVIPLLLAVIAVVVLAKPELGGRDGVARVPRAAFDVGAGLLLGFYDGVFGPGVGTFWAMAYVFGLGFNLTRATGYTKAMNFASNLGALVLFAAAGQVWWTAGVVMGAGQLLGARLGAGLVVRRGAKFIRPVFIAVVLALTAKLIYEAWFRAGS